MAAIVGTALMTRKLRPAVARSTDQTCVPTMRIIEVPEPPTPTFITDAVAPRVVLFGSEMHNAALTRDRTDALVLDREERYVVFAALCAMIDDVHTVQDQMSAAQWDVAQRLYKRLTAIVHKEAP